MIRPSKIEREWIIQSLSDAMASARKVGAPNAAEMLERNAIAHWRAEFGDNEFRDQLAFITATLLGGRDVHNIQKSDLDMALGIAQQILARADAVT